MPARDHRVFDFRGPLLPSLTNSGALERCRTRMVFLIGDLLGALSRASVLSLCRLGVVHSIVVKWDPALFRGRHRIVPRSRFGFAPRLDLGFQLVTVPSQRLHTSAHQEMEIGVLCSRRSACEHASVTAFQLPPSIPDQRLLGRSPPDLAAGKLPQTVHRFARRTLRA